MYRRSVSTLRVSTVESSENENVNRPRQALEDDHPLPNVVPQDCKTEHQKAFEQHVGSILDGISV